MDNLPKLAGIIRHSSPTVRTVEFKEESFVPFTIDMPMLHRMRHIRGLYDMLNDDWCPKGVILLFGNLSDGKGFHPTFLPESIEFRIKNIRCQNHIDNNLTRSNIKDFKLEEQRRRRKVKETGALPVEIASIPSPWWKCNHEAARIDYP